MCKVIIEKPQEKAGFIIFNHIYSRNNDKFTLMDLKAELMQYGLNMTDRELQREINSLIENGAVSPRIGCYKRITML